MNLVANLDIFFITLMSLMYVAFVFFAKRTDSKFMVFFISAFVNIFNYSVVLKNEFNFLTIVLLNLIFILSIMFFYIYVDTNKNVLPSKYIESNEFKNVITILIFIFSFLSISFIFYSISNKKDYILEKNINNKTLISSKLYYYDKNKEKQEKNIIEYNGKEYIVYNRNIKFIEKSNFFKNYNLIIFLYIIILIITFTMNNMKKNER